MRCACVSCGEYMVQTERGLSSGCVCQACGHICTACMGNCDAPKSSKELLKAFEAARGKDAEEKK